MNLTFKRGSESVLNNTNITPNMVYFITDTNHHAIYMDDINGNRNKIFGFNDDDTIESIVDASNNTFFNSNTTGILTQNQVANNGNIVNKYAIGQGYYNNVFGDNIQDTLYKSYPTISSSITYLQTNARSRLNLIWTNDNPATTWQLDISSSALVTEGFDINLSEIYLGYIILIQSCLDDVNTIYPISLFNLPQSIIDNESNSTYSRVEKFTLQTIDSKSIYVDTTLFFTLDNENSVLNITKDGKATNISSGDTFLFHEYTIPIAVYGWRL